MDLTDILWGVAWGTAVASYGTLFYHTFLRPLKTEDLSPPIELREIKQSALKIGRDLVEINNSVLDISEVTQICLYASMQRQLPSDTSSSGETERIYKELAATHYRLLRANGELMQSVYDFQPAEVISQIFKNTNLLFPTCQKKTNLKDTSHSN